MRRASSVTSTGCVREAVCVKKCGCVVALAVDSAVDSAVDDASNKAGRSVLPFISSDGFIADSPGALLSTGTWDEVDLSILRLIGT
jgi:hypothetical protein